MVKKQVMSAVLGILVIWGNQKTFALIILDPAYTVETYISVPGGIGLGWANHMTFDPHGNLYITFRGTSTSVQDGVIYRFTPDKTGDIFATGFIHRKISFGREVPIMVNTFTLPIRGPIYH